MIDHKVLQTGARLVTDMEGGTPRSVSIVRDRVAPDRQDEIEEAIADLDLAIEQVHRARARLTKLLP